MNKAQVQQIIQNEKVIAVIRAETAEQALEMSRAAIEGGIQVIEITATTPNFLSVVEQLIHENTPDIAIGVGTILDSETARQAILKGAQFVVCPHFDKEIIEMCHLHQKLVIPGASNVQYIVECLKSGCHLIKLFPGNLFDSKAIKAFKGPLPQAEFIPTGGINEGNMQEWLKQGAFAVGIGSEWNKFYEKGYREVVSFAKRLLQFEKLV